MKKALLLICLTIFLFMSIETWASLPKSATDDETIEQAIDRLIGVHEGDASAHLGVGESLQSHKASEIIDHEIASIVPDKISSSNNSFVIPVNSTQSLTADNYTSLYPAFMARMIQSTGLSGDATAQFFDFVPDDWRYNGGDICIDFNMWATGASGTYLATMGFDFARVRMKDGYYNVGYYDGSWHYSSDIARGAYDVLKFRIFFNSATGYLYFFCNGVQVYSVAYTLVLENDEFIGKAILNRGSSSTSEIDFGNIRFGFDSTD